MDLAQTLLSVPQVYAAFHRLLSGRKFRQIDRALDTLAPELGNRVSVLDLGCGPGTTSRAFTGRGWDYLGIDLDAGYVEHARQTLSGRYLQGDITRLELDERFELVLINSVLHHLHDDEAEAALARGAGHLVEHGALLLMDMVDPVGHSRGDGVRRLVTRMDRGRQCHSAVWLETLARRRFARVEGSAFALPADRLPLWDMRLFVCREPVAGRQG
jgi:SAM-dependent methyltransferase